MINRHQQQRLGDMVTMRPLTCFLASLLAVCCTARAQSVVFLPDNTISTTDTNRFVAAHGRRSVIMGYPEQGLEMWAYPLQLISNYRIAFLDNGASTEADARPLLRRLIYAPDSVTRLYAGPDYVVREKIFTPLDQSAAIVTYQVDAEHPLNIVIHFHPSLNLMWPGSIGGQYTQWDTASGSYVIGESGLAGSSGSLSAFIASPETIAHDPTVNSTFNTGEQYSFAIHPHPPADHSGPSIATIYMAQLASGETADSTLHKLIAQSSAFETEAAAHYAKLHAEALRLQTPDQQVNAAFAWAEVALDQAWVCNPQLGCGIVAGYGPSRSGRRPQYDWFFGGDGLIATNALITATNYTRAREELEFIIKYQDAKIGMVWHELSQSAGYIDWSKYPYMFVHVDITFDYLKTVARYVAASGDTQFLRDHWTSISNAYRYCQSVIDPQDHYPHIPAGKEGGDEQHRPADDLGLSASWVAAARAYAQLAATAGHAQEAAEALHQADLAQASIAAHYWNPKENFWLDGHSSDGSPIFTRRSGFGEAIDQHIFSPPQINALLNQIASAKFQTDWGVRGAAPNTNSYNSWSYTTASTTAPQTDYLADTYWQNHRPAIAFAMWRSVLPWNWLDSPGHIPELLAGNYYLEQTESVPEQTWCSAAFLDSTIRGLLGIEIHGTGNVSKNSVTFSPRIPADWHDVSIQNLKLPQSTLDLHQDIGIVTATIHNQGAPTEVSFDPQLPLGAKLISASCNGKPIAAQAVLEDEEEHTPLHFRANPGDTQCQLHIDGGVSILLPHPEPEIGNATSGIKLTSLKWHDHQLQMEADVNAAANNTSRIHTPWKIATIEGATAHPSPDDTYAIDPTTTPGNEHSYRRVKMTITFNQQ
jgi:glycogen debranching enzyme